GLCTEHAGIVDERIDPSVALDGKSHDAIGDLCAGDIAIDRKCRRIGALVDRTRVGNDVIADIAIGPEQCRANAPRRPGDDVNLPFGFHIRSFTRPVSAHGGEQTGDAHDPDPTSARTHAKEGTCFGPATAYMTISASSIRLPDGSAKKASLRLMASSLNGSVTILTPRALRSATAFAISGTLMQKW